MIVMLSASYPGHIFKQVVQAFTSPDIPKRPEWVKELSSIGYSDDTGFHSVFMFDVPDAQVADFITLQSKRSAFIAVRAPGCNLSIQLGRTVADGIKELMPLLP